MACPTKNYKALTKAKIDRFSGITDHRPQADQARGPVSVFFPFTFRCGSVETNFSVMLRGFWLQNGLLLSQSRRSAKQRVTPVEGFCRVELAAYDSQGRHNRYR